MRGKKIYRNSSMDLPGPGAYDPRDYLVKPNTASVKIMNPSRSMTSNEIKDYIPGPGQYSPEKNYVSNVKNIPKWTMGTRTMSSSLYGRLEKIHGNNPAPGNYDLNRSIGDGGPKVINIKIINKIFYYYYKVFFNFEIFNNIDFILLFKLLIFQISNCYIESYI